MEIDGHAMRELLQIASSDGAPVTANCIGIDLLSTLTLVGAFILQKLYSYIDSKRSLGSIANGIDVMILQACGCASIN